MKKYAFVFAFFFVTAFAPGCNLSAATRQLPQTTTSQATVESTVTAEENAAPTATETAIFGATAGPTPTLVSAADCPPFALDSISADLARTIGTELFIGKHYDPADYADAVGGHAGEMLDGMHALDDLFKETLHRVFLERLVCRDSGGKAFFEVKDAVIIMLGIDQSITRVCWAGDQPVQPVLAWGYVDLNQPEQVYQDVTGLRFDRVDFAYRIDLEREKFISVSPEGFVCMQTLEGGD